MNLQNTIDALDSVSDSFTPLDGNDFVIFDSKLSIEQLSLNHPLLNDGFIIGFCTEGEARMKLNFREHLITRNSIVFVHPHFVVEILEFSENLEAKAFFLSAKFISTFHLIRDYDAFTQVALAPVIKLEEEDMCQMMDFYDFIIKEYKSVEKKYRLEMMSSLISALNLKIHTMRRVAEEKEVTGTPSSQRKLVGKFMILLLKHYKEERNISFYAEKLNFSPKYLSKVLKDITGQSMLYWINMILVVDAKFKLKTTNMSMKQIANELDFPTPSLFGRFFKNYTGLTPLQYRNS